MAIVTILTSNTLPESTAITKSTASMPQPLISRLPADILLHFFDLAIHRNGAPALLPVILSHVAPSWRALILGAPLLWNTIYVLEDLEPSVAEFRKTLHRVRHYLERSRNLPLRLDITLRSYFNHWPMTDPEHPYHTMTGCFRQCTRDLSEILSPHIRRFRSFSLVCDEFKSIEDVQTSLPHAPMPSLEYIRIQQCYEAQAFDGDLDDIEQASALAMLLRSHGDAEGFPKDMYPNIVKAVLYATPMMWSRFGPTNLQCLNISFLPMQARPTGDELRDILLANEGLVSLTIRGAGPTDFMPQPYILPKLQSLDIGFAYPEEIIPFIESIRLPSLVQLTVTDLQRQLSDVADRQALLFDAKTLDLVKVICDYFPLYQLRVCSLAHMCFFPPISDLPMYPLIKMVTDSATSPFPVPKALLRLFRNMTALRALTINDPDPSTLRCLNYLKVHTTGESDPRRQHLTPLPNLELLHIVDFNLAPVQSFVATRIEHRESLFRLKQLIFSMPASWKGSLGSKLLALAETVSVFDTIIDPAIQVHMTNPNIGH